MKNIFLRAIQFIRENPSILFSLILVILIPTALFTNTYLINSSYEKNFDVITQRKAFVAENIITELAKNDLQDTASLQMSVTKIIEESSDISYLSILKPTATDGDFEIVISSNPDEIGKKIKGTTQIMLAWNNKPEGVAVLDRDEKGRFWNVAKQLTGTNNEKTGLISISCSLSDTDALINKTIYSSYWILLVTMAILLIFVSNQARLLGYAFTVAKLKEIDKMKDMFISMASHELRTPLTAIKGYVEILGDKKGTISEKESDHYIENISISVDRLQNLVSDILEVSRIEGNRLPVEIKKLDPKPILLQIIDGMRPQAEQKNLTFSYSLSDDPVSIEADPERLKQIVINLIGNAIKYTPEGSVEVSASIRDRNFLITVADTGFGISSEDQQNLFQKFYRIQNDNTNKITGTGLGLWIAQEIAHKMKGKITVESIEGVGSHFTLHLPLAKT